MKLAVCSAILLLVSTDALRQRRKGRKKSNSSSVANPPRVAVSITVDKQTSRKSLIPDIQPFTGSRIDCRYPDDCSPGAVTTDEQAFFNVFPGGDTECLDGSEYYFTVRKKDPSKLHIHFQGGGACWGKAPDGWFGGEPEDLIDGCTQSVGDMEAAGAFDVSSDDNAWKDYSYVLINYCSGDIHAGYGDRPWGPRADSGGGLFSRRRTGPRGQVKLRGRTNSEAALSYAQKHFGAASQITVSGSSAGSLATFMWGSRLIKEFGGEGKDLTFVSDSFLPVIYPQSSNQRIQKELFAIWGLCHSSLLSAEQMSRCQSGTLSLQGLHGETMGANPNVRFGVINSKSDLVQLIFVGMVSADFDNPEGENLKGGTYYKEAVLQEKEWRQYSNFWVYHVDGMHHVFVPHAASISSTTPAGLKEGSGGLALGEWYSQLSDPNQANPPRSVCFGELRSIDADTPVGENEMNYCLA